MTEQQAKELRDTLEYISGQLHGIAVLARLIAEVEINNRGKGSSGSIQKFLKSSTDLSSVRTGWKKGYKDTINLIEVDIPQEN